MPQINQFWCKTGGGVSFFCRQARTVRAEVLYLPLFLDIMPDVELVAVVYIERTKK